MKFRKKPIVVEAVQWDGSRESATRIAHAFKTTIHFDAGVDLASGHLRHRPFTDETYGEVNFLKVGTLEGQVIASPGDWIIRGVAGELYPCRPDIFAATYDEAAE